MARALAAAVLAAALAAGGAGAAAPQRGGTVVVAWPGVVEPGCVVGCPNRLSVTSEFTRVMRTAFRATPSGLAPDLVARVTVSRDPFVATLHIRPEARWSDGRPITAADFVFAHRLFLEYSGAPEDHHSRTQVRRMRAVGPKTLRVEFHSPYAVWRHLVGGTIPLPRHLLPDADPAEVWRDAIIDPRSGRPIGSGPFLLERWQKGRQLVLARNPRFPGRTAHVDRLVFRFGLSDPVAALRRGEVDVVGGQGSGIQAEISGLLRQPQRGIRVLSTPGSAWEHLTLRIGEGGHAALRNRLVRRAIAYGLDREAIVRDLSRREAPALRTLHSTAHLANERRYEPAWRTYAHRPELARQLLEQAGCRRGADGIYSCGGQRLSLRFLTTAGVPHRERTLQLAQAQLRRAGIEVVPVYVATVGALLRRGEFDVALFAWTKAPGIAVHTNYRCGHDLNFGGYCNRLVHRDLDQLDRIVDPDRYAAVANQADRKLARDVPVIPLYQTAHFVAFRERVRGVRANPFGSPTWNAEDWWLAR